MYKWYGDSLICYVYLVDVWVDHAGSIPTKPSIPESFKDSRWFKRGWTLQELIAPQTVEFYDGAWTEIGTKAFLLDDLTTITGIDAKVLHGTLAPTDCNVAYRMSWAANRITTREEDIAYCLMGLFDVNIPLLYGEGSKAFQRLQDAIMKMTEDYTLFTWMSKSESPNGSAGIFAESPESFTGDILITGDVHEQQIAVRYSDLRPQLPTMLAHCVTRPQEEWSGVVPVLTSRGLMISLPIRKTSHFDEYQACLTCTTSHRGTQGLCIMLNQLQDQDGFHKTLYRRIKPGQMKLVSKSDIESSFRYETIYIEQSQKSQDYLMRVIVNGMLNINMYGLGSIQDAYVYSGGAYQPSDVQLLGSCTSLTRQFYLVTPILAAVVEVECSTVSITAFKFFVVLGFYKNGASWCDIFLPEKDLLDLVQESRHKFPEHQLWRVHNVLDAYELAWEQKSHPFSRRRRADRVYRSVSAVSVSVTARRIPRLKNHYSHGFNLSITCNSMESETS